MTDLRAAAEMALHALKFSQNMKRCFARAEQDYHEKIAPIAIETLRQALAQPEQEHQPWCDYLNIMLTSLPPQKAKCNCKQAQSEQEHESRITALEIRVAKLENPITDHEKQLMAGQRSLLRTAPPSKPWVSLTDEEIVACGWCDLKFAKAIEAALRSKNDRLG